MELQAELRMRNRAAKAARLSLGMTQVQLAKACGVSHDVIWRIEALRFEKLGVGAAMKVASFLGLPMSDVYPEELRGLKMPSVFTRAIDLPSDRLISMSGNEMRALVMDDPAESDADRMDNEQETGRLLGFLNDRSRDVIKRRYGLPPYFEPQTLADIGGALGITRERVRQVQLRAERDMRARDLDEKAAKAFSTQAQGAQEASAHQTTAHA